MSKFMPPIDIAELIVSNLRARTVLQKLPRVKHYNVSTIGNEIALVAAYDQKEIDEIYRRNLSTISARAKSVMNHLHTYAPKYSSPQSFFTDLDMLVRNAHPRYPIVLATGIYTAAMAKEQVIPFAKEGVLCAIKTDSYPKLGSPHLPYTYLATLEEFIESANLHMDETKPGNALALMRLMTDALKCNYSALPFRIEPPKSRSAPGIRRPTIDPMYQSGRLDTKMLQLNANDRE